MIPVDRSILEQVLNDPARATEQTNWNEWQRQAKEARQTIIEQWESGETSPNVSSLYSKQPVKRALEIVFHQKCVYCEGKPDAQGDWDVEHYRPKGRVHERPDHPGYFWLAYDWDNLLFSCSHCNQRRIDQPLPGDSVRPGKSKGKMDQFPLAEEEKRAMTPDSDQSLEVPLLLNPTLDDPAKFLGFDPTGEIISIQPDDKRGQETLDICNLNRRRLRKSRREHAMAFTELLRLRIELAQENSPSLAHYDVILQKYLTSEKEYAGLCRFIVAHPAAFDLPPEALPGPTLSTTPIDRVALL